MATSNSSTMSKQEADDHLKDIRRRKGVDASNGNESDNVEDLHRALNILSDQLYKKPTHFLLELIQNADDNTFASDIPTVSILLDDHRQIPKQLLRVDCNEVGFNKFNVEALCRIGASTKRDRERSTGYIGEKGIGFKSVFKVADVIRISSGSYEFKFDRRGLLGMVVPIIESFPQQHLKVGQTQTLLELKGNTEFEEIGVDLQALEPQILIFLRKICKLEIRAPLLEGRRRFQIRRLNQDHDFDGLETAILTTKHGGRTRDQRYIIIRRLKTELERDDRRENITETETVLAFPIDERMRPILRAQQSYAYLPIDDYGFNYLIHGDFLLTANRESVDSSKWNRSVRVGVFRAFVSRAVPRFNRNNGARSNLRYTWPLFLKHRGCSNEFWLKLKEWIFHNLSRSEVLESRHGMRLSRPDSLSYIPSRLRFEGEPLIEDESIAPQHLSFDYDAEIEFILPELTQMGVKIMSIDDILTNLRSIIDRRGTAFLEGKSAQWHSQMAILLSREVYPRQLDYIPLIPLRDGRWVTPRHSNLFLADVSSATVPEGLDINLIDTEACQDPSRRTLFWRLGIKNCTQATICHLILKRYSPFHPLNLTHSLQDLLYLFERPRACTPHFSKSSSCIQLRPSTQASGTLIDFTWSALGNHQS